MKISRLLPFMHGYADICSVMTYPDSQWWWFGYASGYREMQTSFKQRSYTFWSIAR